MIKKGIRLLPILLVAFCCCSAFPDAYYNLGAFWRAGVPLSFTVASQSGNLEHCMSATVHRPPPASGSLTVNLSGANAVFYSDSLCSVPITSVSLANGVSNQIVYMTFSATGAQVITDSANGASSGTQTDTIAKGIFDKYEYSSLAAWDASGSAIVSDASGNVYSAGYGTAGWEILKYSGSSWSVIDQFNYVEYAMVYSLTIDPSGTLYAAGYGADSSYNLHWLVRMYSAGVWSTIDDFTYPGGSQTTASVVTSDSLGNIYAAGYAYDSSNNSHWIVREYSGGVWSTIDDYFDSTGAVASGATHDQSGNIYVVGSGSDSSNNGHWIVREYSGGVWSTVDDFYYGGSYTSASAMTIDPSGNIYVAGLGYDSSNHEHWIVRMSSGGSWSTIDDFTYGGGALYSVASGITSDSSGNIYVAGVSAISGWSSDHWIVRKYSGGSWSTIDDYIGVEGHYASAAKITSDPSGNIYAVGYEFAGGPYNQWTVRKYNGSAWSTIELFENGYSWSGATALGADASGNVFAAGFSDDEEYIQHWIVREFTSGSWGTIDDHQYTSGASANANALTVDTSGNVYVGGQDGGYWEVREYSGGAWSTIDDYLYLGGSNGQANTALTTDFWGNLYAAGYAADSSSTLHWIVREYSAGSWSTIDDYLYPSGVSAQASALTSDSSGNIYAAGTGQDASDSAHWIVREYSGGTWSTVDDYTYPGGDSSLYAVALTSDSSGNVYAAGYVYDNSWNQHWIVREYSGGVWNTIDDYTFPSGTGAAATSLTVDALGNVYAGGTGTTSAYYNSYWIVRELSSGSWSTVQEFQPAPGQGGAVAAMANSSTYGVLATGMEYFNPPNQFWVTQSVP